MNEQDDSSETVPSPSAPAPPSSEPVQPVADITMVEATWSGPLPPPDTLQQYEELVPGAANRILVMAESQIKHDQNQENMTLEITRTVINGNSKRGYLGILSAFIIAMTGIGCGTFLSAIGREGIGAAFVVVPLVGLAGVFVHGTQSRRAERNRRSSERE